MSEKTTEMANSKSGSSVKARDAISESDLSEAQEDISLDNVDGLNKSEDVVGGTNSRQTSVNQNDDTKDECSSEGKKDQESDFEPGRDSVSSREGGIQVAKDRPVDKNSKSSVRQVKSQASNGGPRSLRTSSEEQENKSKPRSVRGAPKKASKNTKGVSDAKPKTHSDNQPRSTKSSAKSSSEQSGSEDKQSEGVKEPDVFDDEPNGTPSVITDDECIDAEDRMLDQEKIPCNTDHIEKIQEMELRVEKLEEELRETAALEVALYSVVAEHGSSAHKVHAPARRLSRLYIHACKHWSSDSRGTVAKSAVSGLVLIAKACGNDVPRLTFWLSNVVILREIISQAFGIPHSSSLAGRVLRTNGGMNKSTPLSWKGNGNRNGKKLGFTQFVDDWQETSTFTSALEKIEAWIFSRIIESVWWQTLIPYMQPPAQRLNNSKGSPWTQRPHEDQQQGIFSLDLWKQAFFDASQRLCPVRAGGHECGCLPVLARMVMQQCVARLDVAMFNAILRQSEREIPTDPVSDPITDANVLPIPAGDLSFGSGAQLKNAIGHWSRWLTELFGMDMDHNHKEDEINEDDDDRKGDDAASKSFPLLNALSDLLMLPKDMLIDKAIRKEVCPMFGISLLKRILCNFTPDEFCPDPVPGILLEVLNSESVVERRTSDKDFISSFPCTAAAVDYRPPPSSCVAEKAADIVTYAPMARSASIIRRKGHTSDEELEELDDPLACIIENVPRSPSVGNGKLNGIDGNKSMFTRYDLLRQVWSAGN